MTDSASPAERPYAALITIDFANQNVMWTIFDDTTEGGDPVDSAKRLAESVRGDWPSHEQHVIANQAARDIYGPRMVARLLGEPEPVR